MPTKKVKTQSKAKPVHKGGDPTAAATTAALFGMTFAAHKLMPGGGKPRKTARRYRGGEGPDAIGATEVSAPAAWDNAPAAPAASVAPSPPHPLEGGGKRRKKAVCGGCGTCGAAAAPPMAPAAPMMQGGGKKKAAGASSLSAYATQLRKIKMQLTNLLRK